jgi:CRP/FNR family transcriptional regulator, cyclic AMP receptor protein
MPVHFDPEVMRLLAAASFFQGLDRATLELVAQTAVERLYQPDRLVILEGEPPAGLFIIQWGRLKASKMGLDGREQILELLGAGDLFNAVSVFANQPHPATVTALESSKIWMIPQEAMLQLLETNPRLARGVIQSLAGRVLHLVALVEDLSLRSVEARLARLLLEKSVEGVIARRRWATQTEIAARLGTVPDVISRSLHKLANQGLIQMDRRAIRILDHPKLVALAKLEPPD